MRNNNKSKIITLFFLLFFVFATIDKGLILQVTRAFKIDDHPIHKTYSKIVSPIRTISTKLRSAIFWKMYSPATRHSREVLLIAKLNNREVKLGMPDYSREHKSRTNFFTSQFVNFKINKVLESITYNWGRKSMNYLRFLCNYYRQYGNKNLEWIKAYYIQVPIPHMQSRVGWKHNIIDNPKAHKVLKQKVICAEHVRFVTKIHF